MRVSKKYEQRESFLDSSLELNRHLGFRRLITKLPPIVRRKKNCKQKKSSTRRKNFDQSTKEHSGILKTEDFFIKPPQETYEGFGYKMTLENTFYLQQMWDTEPYTHQICEIWVYLSNIGEHLLKRQGLYVPGKVQPNELMCPYQHFKAIQWIITVSSKLNFKLQTIFGAVNILDRSLRVLSSNQLPISVFTLTVLFVAAKYEQVAIPKLQAFIFASNYRVRKQQIFSAELVILKALQFDLGYISPLKFIDLFCTRLGIQFKTRQKAYNIAKKTVFCDDLCQHKPSVIALSCLELALPSLNLTDQLDYKTKIDLQDCYLTLQTHLKQHAKSK